VKSDALEAGILAMGEPFTIKDVVDNVGGSPMTVKVVIDRLEAQERISAAGERANVRGRASKLWKVA
jgi:predicted ArsR family transcriptional regulator